MGGNVAIQARYRCPIMLPEGEAPLIDAWDEKALLLGYCDQRAERFHYDEIIKPGQAHVWGDLEWRALAAPGHDMSALVFYNPEHRILISGDALWHDGFGLVMPLEVDPRALPAARATLEMLARLDIRTVIPGHGEPFGWTSSDSPPPSCRPISIASTSTASSTSDFSAFPLRHLRSCCSRSSNARARCGAKTAGCVLHEFAQEIPTTFDLHHGSLHDTNRPVPHRRDCGAIRNQRVTRHRPLRSR